MRWEYKTLEFKQRNFLSGKFRIEELQSELDNLGRQGWELVQVSPNAASAFAQGMFFVFKRPVQ